MKGIKPSNGHGTPPEPEVADVGREELFPEENYGRVDDPLVNTMDVTQKIFAIRYLERLIERFTKQDQESRMFYSQKKQKCEEQIEFIKRSVLAFLNLHEMKNLQTPAGTAYQREVTTKVWPDDRALLAWAKENLPEAVREKAEPDKKVIGEYIKQTGITPDGYSEENEIRLGLR